MIALTQNSPVYSIIAWPKESASAGARRIAEAIELILLTGPR
jgi:hypothetical protein